MKTITDDLPPELQALASLLDAQPPEVQEAFQFLPATAMHEAGKLELLNLAGGFPARRTLLVTAISRCQKTSHPNLDHETHERPETPRGSVVVSLSDARKRV